MKRPQEYLGTTLSNNLYDINRQVLSAKRLQVKSKEQKRLDKTINILITEIKTVSKDPQSILAMETMCILLEKSAFSNTEQDINRCSNQLMENMEAISAVELIKNKAEYLEKVKASGASTHTLPKTDAFLNVIDKRIKYLGAAMNAIDASPARKKFFLVRQENLRLAKKLYIELQKEALGLDNKKKSQSLSR